MTEDEKEFYQSYLENEDAQMDAEYSRFEKRLIFGCIAVISTVWTWWVVS
jgi:hypothetical protein